MQSLKSQLQDTRVTLEDAFQSFRDGVMANSAVVRSKQSQTASNSTTPSALHTTRDGAVPAINLSQTSANGRGRPLSSSGKHDRPSSRERTQPTSSRKDSKSGGLTPRTPGGEESSMSLPLAAAPLPPKAFSLDAIKQVVEYATRTYFQHFNLYRAVFTPSHFRPRKNRLIERLLLETPVPLSDAFALDRAVDLNLDEAKRKEIADRYQAAHAAAAEEKTNASDIWSSDDTAHSTRPGTANGLVGAGDAPHGTDDISLLVHEHMVTARLQLQSLIADNERQLDAKIKQLEQRVGAPPTNGKQPHATPSKKK